MFFQVFDKGDGFLHAALFSYTLGVLLSVVPRNMPVIGKVAILAMLACVCIWLGSFVWTLFEASSADEYLDEEEKL